MGRIVIPRVRQEARQQLQRKRRTGYFANGFGPQEMQLVSQLADLAVAGGGQIARAVQISNRERDYEQRVQSEIDRRQEAAQAEMREAQMSSGPQAFADSFFMDMSGEEPLSVREQIRRDDITFGPDGPTPMRGAQIVATGGIAPEDTVRMLGIEAPSAPEPAREPLVGATPADLMRRTRMPGLRAAYQSALARGDRGTMGRIAREGERLPSLGSAYLTPPAGPADGSAGLVNVFDPRGLIDMREAYSAKAPDALIETGELAGYDVSTGAYIPPEPGAPSAPPTPTKADILREARAAGINPRSALVQEALARAPEFVDEEQVYYDYQEPLDIYSPRLEELRQAQRAAQERDFRQEAIEAVGPRPLFRIADILAAAPSARTAEQRAMLLQAAADSPDIQATSLSDLAKGAYRDRAMQAVMKLFPEEEEPVSELDKLRIESMRESIETENLRQQKLQAALDKEAAKLARRAKRGGGTGKSRELMEQAAYVAKNYLKYKAGEIDMDRWRYNTGPFWQSSPSSLALDGRVAGLRGGDLKMLKSAEKNMLSAERIAQAGARIDQAEQRLRDSRAKADAAEGRASKRFNISLAKLSADADAKAAKAAYASNVLAGMDEEDASAIYTAKMQSIADNIAAPTQQSETDAAVERARAKLRARREDE